jgi:quercetin dioxygenase-like cupin family protein
MRTITLVTPVAGWTTEGQYALVEAAVEAGTEIPAHVASREDVVVHVLAGELEAVVDRLPRTLTTGDTLLLPRGATRRLTATRPSRVLALLTPAGLEELLPLAADPQADPDDRAALLTVGGIQVVPAA